MAHPTIDIQNLVKESDEKSMFKFILVRLFSEACNKKDATEIKRLAEQYRNHGFIKNITRILNEETFATAESTRQYRQDGLHILFENFYEQCSPEDKLFFAAVQCDLEELTYLLGLLRPEEISGVRYTDSVIVFVLKYGNISDENFLLCMKTLIQNVNTNLNKHDWRGNTAVDHVARLYKEYGGNNAVCQKLQAIAECLLEEKICRPDNKDTINFLINDMKTDLKTYQYSLMDDKEQLFYWIIKKKKEEFVEFVDIRGCANLDDGENTLLQFSSKMRADTLPFVKHLLANNANPNKTTSRNNLTPLELAAKSGHVRIFQEILKTKETKIEEKHFENFIKWRIKPDLFKEILDSEKLDVNFTNQGSGNTPLHYAIYSKWKDTIQNLLGRKASLLKKNKMGTSAINIIQAADMEKFLDSCLAYDKSRDVAEDDCKVTCRFDRLIYEEPTREIEVVAEIGKAAHLEHLLTHPLIYTFVDLKWFKVRSYYYAALATQSCLSLLLWLFFYCWPGFLAIRWLLAALNLPKFIIIAFSSDQLTPLKSVSLHGVTEALLVFTTFLSLFIDQVRTFIFTLMAVAFLLTVGYHPKLSKWSLMLQKVFRTFALLLMFFSSIFISFTLGFQIISEKNQGHFKSFSSSLFRITLMSTGEFNVEEDDIPSFGLGGYALFIFFILSVSLILVNFWTGIAISDIEKIEKKSEINAVRNVVTFIAFVESNKRCLVSRFRNIFRPASASASSEAGQTDLLLPDARRAKQWKIDFFLNRTQHFEGRDDLPDRIQSSTLKKLRSHFSGLDKLTKAFLLKRVEELETNLLQRFNEIAEKLNSLDAKFSSRKKQKGQ